MTALALLFYIICGIAFFSTYQVFRKKISSGNMTKAEEMAVILASCVWPAFVVSGVVLMLPTIGVVLAYNIRDWWKRK